MLARLLSGDQVVAIAHRGGSRLRPENTMAAFDHAATLGVDGLECDVRLSRDGEVIVIHDDSLDRTSDASGRVSRHTAIELSRVDAGAHFRDGDTFPFRGRGFGVPRLRDVLERHPTLPFIIEIKGQAIPTARAALDVVVAMGAEDRVVFGGFSQAVLDFLRRAAPAIPTSASKREVKAALWRARLRLQARPGPYQLLQVPYHLRGRRIFGQAFVASSRTAGIPVQAWIVDMPRDMQALIGWGVSGLISDRPDLAVECARAARSPYTAQPTLSGG